MKQPATPKKRKRIEKEGLGPNIIVAKRSFLLLLLLTTLFYSFSLLFSYTKEGFVQTWKELGRSHTFGFTCLQNLQNLGTLIIVWSVIIFIFLNLLHFGFPILREKPRICPKSKGQKALIPLFAIVQTSIFAFFLYIQIHNNLELAFHAAWIMISFSLLILGAMDLILGKKSFEAWIAMEPQEVAEEVRQEYGNPLVRRYGREQWNAE
ncbi:MAG: hypothetical protein D6785_07265 [Planctomycetota bacterium]|nr:MAG: hypothetical protein D6785_07265 [Planctomycetota bacterium]